MFRDLSRTAIAGLVCIGLGFLAIFLGYNGAARVACVDCQLPYILSGGAIGLALIVLGAGLIVFEAMRRGRAHIEQKLDALIEALQGQAPRAAEALPEPPPIVAPSRRRGRQAAATATANGRVVVGRTSFHLPDCRLVQGKEGLDYATFAEATAQGLQPCRVCEPARVGR